MWYLGTDLAVAQVPKAGLNTMQEWLNGFRVVGNDDPELLACPRRVLFIRNPINRLVSAYSFFKDLDERGQKHSCGAPTETWKVFVDHVLQREDEHWMPQIEHSGNMQNIVHRLEDINQIWHRYYPGSLPWNNRTHRRPASNYRLPEIVEEYMDDFDLWLRAID